MPGRVAAIHLAAEAEAPTFAVERVTARADLGLEGDRLVNAARADGGTVPGRRQVTLIEAEALAALQRDYDIDLTPAASRRNICTEGVALNHLVGRDFRVGAAVLHGEELCEPCGTLERLSGRKGACRGLIHRGGLRARVVTGGDIRPGDPVEPL